MKSKRRIATTTVIVCSLLLVVFFVLYDDYSNTYIEENHILKKYQEIEARLNSIVYKALKDEAQYKVDNISRQISKELSDEYNGDLTLFEKEYEHPSGESILVDTVGKYLTSRDNKYLHIRSQDNTMTAMTNNHIISDSKIASDVFIEERAINEYSKSNKNNSNFEQVYNTMETGIIKDVFKNSGDLNIRHYDIDAILKEPTKNLRSIVFFSYNFIDKEKDLLGNKYTYASGGVNKDNKKIIIAQRFNLYEHITERFLDDYEAIQYNKEKDIAVLKERRKKLALRIITITALIFISFYSISSLQKVKQW